MSLSRNQIVVVGVTGLILFLGVLIFLGVIPGLRTERDPSLEGELTFWGIEEYEIFRDQISAFTGVHPKVKINYEQIDAGNYETKLIDALAAGRGPDIFEIENTWLPKHYNKLSPLGEDIFPLVTFRELFPRVVEQDFAPDGIIFSLPLYIDTLALYYNKDIFDDVGLVFPPKDWTTFLSQIGKLRKISSSGGLKRAAVALGGSEQSVEYATDIISNIMLQAGVEMTESNFSRAIFASNLGKEAFNFYLRFTDPKNSAFTWTESFGKSSDAFAEGKVAMTINYAEFRNFLNSKNLFLEYGISEMPQIQGTSQSINFSRYRGLAISNQTRHFNAAYEFIKYLTTDVSAAENYSSLTGRPPALRTLIQKYINHPDMSVFVNQALRARSWPQIDNVKISKYFSTAISDVLMGKLSSGDVLERVENEVTSLMDQSLR